MERLRVGFLIFLLAACGSNDGSSTLMLSSPQSVSLQREVAFPNLTFSNPLFITHAGDGSNRLFVVEQAGRILIFPNNPSATMAEVKVFLDKTSDVRSGGELGMLGLAFDPDYATNGFFYVNYTTDNPLPLRTHVSRFQVSADDLDQADADSETILLEFDQPFENHNGGMLTFGPDGKLYISSGDGGSGNDPDDNAQSLNTVLGKILRINPNPNDLIPSDNPFVGDPEARGEIWAYGLRNPWRMSLDRETGRLWAGDVGQGAREEIDIIEPGGNYGWRVYEGTLSNINPMNIPITEFIAPVHEYGRDLGQSITGGYVYRGPGLPDFNGAYLYADFVSGRVWALVYDSDTDTVVSNTEVATVPNPSSFGEDEAGELYVTSFDGGIYRFRQM